MRQVRYNEFLDTTKSDEKMPFYWMFFILNARREADEIKQKILRYFTGDFKHSDNLVELDSGVLVREGALIGKLISFDSSVGQLTEANKRAIYDTRKWYMDRRLIDDVAFHNYCEQFKR